jgi:hypothetical protein
VFNRNLSDGSVNKIVLADHFLHTRKIKFINRIYVLSPVLGDFWVLRTLFDSLTQNIPKIVHDKFSGKRSTELGLNF